jgi:hypothetical protein
MPEAYNGRTLAEAKAIRIARIKQEAAERINAAFPAYKRENASDPFAVDYDEAKHREMRSAVDAIRQTSNDAEARVAGLKSVEEVKAFTW